MSEILNLEKVDTSQLSEGLEIKNYRALCELVGEEPKTGNGKKAQLKEWERFFAVEKVKGSQKMIVTEIYERPKERKDKRLEGVYVKSIELILLYELAKMSGYRATFTKNRLWHRLGMVNDNYKRIAAADLKGIDTCITDFEINHFYQRSDSRLNKILMDALNSLKRRWVLDYQEQYRIVDRQGNRRIAEDIDIGNIITIKNRVARSLGCKDEREIFMKMKTAEFYKALTYYYGYYFGWAYVYKEYKLIFNQEIIKEEIPEVEVELQKELLNASVAEAIERTATQNYITCKAKDIKLPKLYQKAQGLLIDALIRLDGNESEIASKRISDDTEEPDSIRMLTCEESSQIDDELDALFGM